MISYVRENYCIDKDDIITVNVNLIGYYHSLLSVQRCKQLSQIISKYSLFKAIELFSLSP